jgi:hypothetical protein
VQSIKRTRGRLRDDADLQSLVEQYKEELANVYRKYRERFDGAQ